jgi:hypothetical protein
MSHPRPILDNVTSVTVSSASAVAVSSCSVVDSPAMYPNPPIHACGVYVPTPRPPFAAVHIPAPIIVTWMPELLLSPSAPTFNCPVSSLLTSMSTSGTDSLVGNVGIRRTETFTVAWASSGCSAVRKRGLERERVVERGDGMESTSNMPLIPSPHSESLYTLCVPLIPHSHNRIPLSLHDTPTPQAHSEPLMVTVPLLALSPDVSVMDDFHAASFARAALGVSQILSKVNSKDELILSVGKVHEWFLQSMSECGVEYIDALNLPLKLDWHTHASRLGVDVDPPDFKYLLLPSCQLKSALKCNDIIPTLNSDEIISEELNSEVYLKGCDASNVGLIHSQNLMQNSKVEIVFSGGGFEIKNSKNLKTFTKNSLTDSSSVQVIPKQFFFTFLNFILLMVFLVNSLHELHFSHYFLLQQHKRSHSS